MSRKLQASNICKGSYGDGDLRCALGWIEFLRADASEQELLRSRLRDMLGIDSISQWNDNSAPEVVAETLNQFFEKEGICVS